MDIKAFTYHKRAEKYCDCQDCFGIASQNNRIAISDGMSQSIFPQWWAKILVDAFLNTGKIPDRNNIIRHQQKWQELVRNEIAKQESEGNNPWLLRDMFAERSGAAATLCGFEWNDKEWTCQCIGDSCLIKVNNDYSINIITSQVGRLDNHPDYLDSFKDRQGNPIEETGNFDLKVILLVSDPLAELFQSHQNDTKFICDRLNEILNLHNHESFITLVETWRDIFNMHNDDTTIVILNNFRNSSINILWEDNLYQLITAEKEIEHKHHIKKEKEKAEAQLLNSVQQYLSFYPKENKRSKGKVFNWLNKTLNPVIELFSKE